MACLYRIDGVRPPNLRDLMDEVGSKTNRWSAIALQLELTMTEIERIDMENPQNVQDCFHQVFVNWEKSAKVPYCWHSIVNALKAPSVCENRLASTISDKYLH